MAQDPVDQARVAEKIKKLLALGTSPNESEAAAAVAKAQELMFRYNLSIEDLVTQVASLVGERTTDINANLTWTVRLALAVAESSLCRYYVIQARRVIGGRYTAKLDRKIVFVGRDHDTELAELILAWLMGELNRLSNEYSEFLSGSLMEYTPAARKVARRSWLEGAATTVASRLVEGFETRRTSSQGAMGLVVHRSADVDDFLKTKGLTRLKANATTRKTDWDAYSKGRSDGHEVDLRPGQRKAQLTGGVR
jgi:hypothetical protein